MTYQARYVYSLLAATADDEVINDALGTYENVVAGFSQNNWSVLAVQGKRSAMKWRTAAMQWYGTMPPI